MTAAIEGLGGTSGHDQRDLGRNFPSLRGDGDCGLHQESGEKPQRLKTCARQLGDTLHNQSDLLLDLLDDEGAQRDWQHHQRRRDAQFVLHLHGRCPRKLDKPRGPQVLNIPEGLSLGFCGNPGSLDHPCSGVPQNRVCPEPLDSDPDGHWLSSHSQQALVRDGSLRTKASMGLHRGVYGGWTRDCSA